MTQVTIHECTTPADRLRFIQFWWVPYKGNAYWVPPLVDERQEFLDPARSAFHKHADVALFLAQRDGQPVGTVAALVNHRHNEFHDENIGFFGFFECIDDYAVAEALLTAACDWCKARGVSAIRGPANFSSNEEYGLLIDAFDDAPRAMMTYNPPYYKNLIEKFGFEKAMDLYAYMLEVAKLGGSVNGMTPKLLRVAQKARERYGIVIRNPNMKNLAEEIARLKSVYNSAWEKNWGFVPMTEQEFDHLAEGLAQFVDPDVIFLAEKDGQCIGFSLSLPDMNQALLAAYPSPSPNPLSTNWAMLKLLWHWKVRSKITWLRIVAMGVVEEWRSHGIAAQFYYETAKAAIPKGYKYGEMSWILESNMMMNRDIQTLGGRVYKTYRIYQKPL
jgi:GNAT superfamily N-acetyltransferase